MSTKYPTKPLTPGYPSDEDTISRDIRVPAPQRREPGVPCFVTLAGVGLGSIHAIDAEQVELGRDLSNRIAFRDDTVSRRHARVVWDGAQWWLLDLGSKNGTWVNEGRVDEHALEDGDRVRIGQTTLKFLAGDSLEYGYYETLHAVAVEDALTGLPNRRYLDEILSREIPRARRHGRPLVMLMLDLDHFKRINDERGHVCGDRVLRELARLLEARLRASEFLARYGGEEFAFVLPEADPEGARTFAERIRERVASHVFDDDGESLRITVSIGGASWHPGMKAESDLIEAADRGLYEAKRAGRNRVVVDR